MLQLTVQNVPLSRVILGSTYFGSTLDAGQSFALLDLYYDLGGRTIDTARVYGAWGGQIGAAEAVIGRWLRLSGHNDVIVITKCAHPAPENRALSRLDPKSIRDDLERSADALDLREKGFHIFVKKATLTACGISNRIIKVHRNILTVFACYFCRGFDIFFRPQSENVKIFLFFVCGRNSLQCEKYA